MVRAVKSRIELSPASRWLASLVVVTLSNDLGHVLRRKKSAHRSVGRRRRMLRRSRCSVAGRLRRRRCFRVFRGVVWIRSDGGRVSTRSWWSSRCGRLVRVSSGLPRGVVSRGRSLVAWWSARRGRVVRVTSGLCRRVVIRGRVARSWWSFSGRRAVRVRNVGVVAAFACGRPRAVDRRGGLGMMRVFGGRVRLRQVRWPKK